MSNVAEAVKREDETVVVRVSRALLSRWTWSEANHIANGMRARGELLVSSSIPGLLEALATGRRPPVDHRATVEHVDKTLAVPVDLDAIRAEARAEGKKEAMSELFREQARHAATKAAARRLAKALEAFRGHWPDREAATGALTAYDILVPKEPT